MSALEGLAACAGRWRGTSTLQDPMSGKPDESPSEMTVTPVLGGRFVRLDYTWAYQGAAQEGSLLVGSQGKAGTVSGHWIDCFHNGEKVMACTGTAAEGSTLALRGSYEVPGHPGGGWRIDLLPEGGSLRVVMFNAWPEDQPEELAVEAVYSRA